MFAFVLEVLGGASSDKKKLWQAYHIPETKINGKVVLSFENRIKMGDPIKATQAEIKALVAKARSGFLASYQEVLRFKFWRIVAFGIMDYPPVSEKLKGIVMGRRYVNYA